MEAMQIYGGKSENPLFFVVAISSSDELVILSLDSIGLELFSPNNLWTKFLLLSSQKVQKPKDPSKSKRSKQKSGLEVG